MKKANRVPSYSRIISTDYRAFLASLVPILLFFLFLLYLVVERSLPQPLLPQAQQAMVLVFIVLTILTVLYLLYRAWSIRRVFQRGSDVQGKVTSLHFRKMGGMVGYTYSFGQKRVNCEAALRLNAHAKALRKGERVLVVVDHDNPKKAFIRDLYR